MRLRKCAEDAMAVLPERVNFVVRSSAAPGFALNHTHRLHAIHPQQLPVESPVRTGNSGPAGPGAQSVSVRASGTGSAAALLDRMLLSLSRQCAAVPFQGTPVCLPVTLLQRPLFRDPA